MWIVNFTYRIHAYKYSGQAIINLPYPELELNHYRKLAEEKALKTISKVYSDVTIVDFYPIKFIDDCFIL